MCKQTMFNDQYKTGRLQSSKLEPFKLKLNLVVLRKGMLKRQCSMINIKLERFSLRIKRYKRKCSTIISNFSNSTDKAVSFKIEH